MKQQPRQHQKEKQIWGAGPPQIYIKAKHGYQGKIVKGKGGARQ